jgi:hypothetical protein
MFTFTCEKCGGQFYSKADPSAWRHKLCNACSGKPYKDLPVAGGTSYTPHPVPTSKPQYNNVPPQPVKKEFDDEEYMADIISTYVRLSAMCDEAKITIPVDNLCNWTTSIMIQKGRM